MDYRICWLTLNRACNLQCKWCYAKDTHYKKCDDMDLQTAKNIIDICSDLKINHIALIGGEPTLYPYLEDVIDYCHSKSISCGIITNGLKLADDNFIKKMKDVNQNGFSISLKGENKETFKEITGKDGFEETLKGIQNCINNKINISVSMVLTEENIDTFVEGIELLKKMGVKKYHFSFCYEFAINDAGKEYLKNNNPKRIVQKFVQQYDKLNDVTDGNFELFETFPLCIWDKEFINKMNNRGQISTVCQLLHRSGLIFDPKGYLLPCNSMTSIKLGKLYEDFSNAKELIEFSKSKRINSIYDKLCSVPDKQCLSCDEYINCGGGCVCHWTNYDFATLKEMEL